MAGAKVTMMASELLQNGIGRIKVILDEMRHWMDEHEYESVCPDDRQHEPAALCRAGSLRTRKLHEDAGVVSPDQLSLPFSKNFSDQCSSSSVGPRTSRAPL